jgi:hypothetical protein
VTTRARRRLLEGEWRELLLLAGVVVAQAILNWHFASRSFFVADDLVGFEDARSGSYSPDYLFAIHGGHLSPGRRAVTLFLQYHATLDYHAALGLLLAAHSIGVVLVQRILRLLFGVRWWTLAVAFAYGISIVIQPSLQWFSAGVLILPGATFGLAAIHGYLCWWRTGRRAWLVWSAVAVTGGLLFYIKTLLVPLYIVLIRVFLLDPDRRIRESARAAAREWATWLAYAIPLAAALIVYLAQDRGGDGATGITLHTALDYFKTAWSAGFVPALFGVRIPVYGDAAFRAVAIAGCQIALVAAVALSIVRRRSAWRPWALLVCVFLLNAALVAPRLGLGSAIAYALRYFTETAYFAAIVVPFAFARPAADWPPVGSPLPRWTARLAPAAGLLAVYVAFAWASDAAFTRHWPGRESRAWFENVRGDLDALSRDGVEPVLLDGALPPRILPFWVAQDRLPAANSLPAVLDVFHPGLRFDEVSARTYRVRDDGHVEAVVFAPAEVGNPVCVGGVGRPGSVEWRLARPQRGGSWYLRATYRTDPGADPYLAIDRGSGFREGDDRPLPPRPRGGTTLVAPTAFLTTAPTVPALRLGVRSGRACFTRLAVGSFLPAG